MSEATPRRTVYNELRLFYCRWMLRMVGGVLVAFGWPLAVAGVVSLVLPGVLALAWNGVPVQAAQQKLAFIGLGAVFVATGGALLWVRSLLPPGISPFSEEAQQVTRRRAPDAEPGAAADGGGR